MQVTYLYVLDVQVTYLYVLYVLHHVALTIIYHILYYVLYRLSLPVHTLTSHSSSFEFLLLVRTLKIVPEVPTNSLLSRGMVHTLTSQRSSLEFLF